MIIILTFYADCRMNLVECFFITHSVFTYRTTLFSISPQTQFQKILKVTLSLSSSKAQFFSRTWLGGIKFRKFTWFQRHFVKIEHMMRTARKNVNTARVCPLVVNFIHNNSESLSQTTIRIYACEKYESRTLIINCNTYI